MLKQQLTVAAQLKVGEGFARKSRKMGLFVHLKLGLVVGFTKRLRSETR
jgi:hypothetical protein